MEAVQLRRHNNENLHANEITKENNVEKRNYMVGHKRLSDGRIFGKPLTNILNNDNYFNNLNKKNEINLTKENDFGAPQLKKMRYNLRSQSTNDNDGNIGETKKNDLCNNNNKIGQHINNNKIEQIQIPAQIKTKTEIEREIQIQKQPQLEVKSNHIKTELEKKKR